MLSKAPSPNLDTLSYFYKFISLEHKSYVLSDVEYLYLGHLIINITSVYG